MKKLTILFILMILGSSVLFAQINTKEQIEKKARVSLTDVDPNARVNPHASTFTDDLFDYQFDFSCGDASGEAGIETNGEYIYTSKWNGDGFFCYEMDGTFLGSFPVSGEAAVRDLAYDGTYFYGAAACTQLFEMDFNGQSGTIVGILSAAVATRACAYNPDYDAFYGNNWSDPITLYDRSGGILNQFNCGAFSSYYGFTYVNPSDEGPWLYGFAQAGGTSQSIIVQINPETGAETGVTFDAIGYSTTGTGMAGGLASFDTYAPGLWTLLGIIQNETIFGVEGGPAGLPPELDLALKNILEPNTGFGLGVENIIIKVKNQGIITQSDFNVQYRVDGGSWVTETIAGPLAQKESIDYTFSASYDFSAYAEYFIEAEVILAGDERPENNSDNKTIYNWDPSEWCEYSITLWDDYGDGWSGGYVQIFGDGVEYINATIASGAGPETYEFLVQDGSFLTAIYTPGGWPEENSYAVYDADDNLIFEDGMGGVEPSGGDIGFASCWLPDLDAGITDIISPQNGINMGDEVVTVNVHNYGLLELNDVPVGFKVDNGTLIMEIAPGPIYYDDNYEYTFTTTADLSEYGPHIIEACTFLDGDERQENDCLEKDVFNYMDIPNQIYNLSAGYQFISSSIVPPDPDMIEVMTDVLNENLDFVRNSQGQTLRKIGPNWVNNIGNWIIEEGYLVKMFAEDSFTIEGDLVDPSTPIALFEGFQFVSYLPLVQIDALEAFESIIGDNLVFIRNSQAQTLRKIGPNWINGIGNCIPKQGYLIKMINEGELIYPSATCGFPFIDSRNGQIYNTVQIGDQCWMAENLNIGTQIDGLVTMSDNSIIEKYCYDDDSMNCELYGGLYQWNEMMQYKTAQSEQGICPNGWHLPSDAEWFEMENYLDPSINNPDITGWRGIDCGEQLLAGGSSGFEVLLAGKREWNTGGFTRMGERAHFWTSTINSYNPEDSWFRQLHNDETQIYRNGASKLYGVSVRCVKDEINTCVDPIIDPRDGQVYNIVQIGDQCCMAENLNIGVQIDGIQTMSDNSIIEKYCYDDDSSNCETYGGLYQWNEMMQYEIAQSRQGICPNGWHLPSDGEWFEMENFLDPSITDPNSTFWRGIDCGEQLLAGGSSGFEALLAGQRKWDTGEFLAIGEWTNYWSSTINPYNPTHSWWRALQVDNPKSYRNGGSKLFGLSVRCLRDETISLSKKSISILNEGKVNNHIITTNYFTFKGGNPADPVFTLYLDGLEIGDEVAAFDGEIMLGSMRISSEKEFNNELPVFSTLVNGKGYESGNPISLKVWDISTQSLIPFEYTMIDPYNEAYMKNTYPEEDGLYSIVKFTKGVNNIENVEEFISIFPNPSDGIFNILIKGMNETIQVKVFDVHGNNYYFFKIEGTRNLTTQKLDLKELAAGVYFINFCCKDFSQVKKIVIQ